MFFRDIVQLSRTQPNMSDILIFEDLGPGVQVNEMRVRRQLCRDGRLLNWSVRQPTQLWAKADPAQFLLAVGWLDSFLFYELVFIVIIMF